MDDEYILGIVLQHKQHLLLAGVTVLICTASNLAAPVLSGMLFEHLVQQHPLEKYAQVSMSSWCCGVTQAYLCTCATRSSQSAGVPDG